MYSIFGSKEALVDAVLAKADTSFTNSQRRALARPASSPVESLTLLGVAYRRWALDHPALYAVMFSRNGAVATNHVLDADGIAPLRSVVQECFGAGIFSPGPDVRDVVLSIWASVHGFVSLEIGQLCFPTQRAAERCYRTHLAAIVQSWRANPVTAGTPVDG